MMSDFYTETLRKARKSHKCSWCKDEIKPGDDYVYAGGVFDGNFSMRKECLKCNLLIREMFADEEWREDFIEYGFCDDDMHEFWRQRKCHECEYKDCDDMTHFIRCNKFKEES
jgi:hypothetical protein